MSRIDDVHQLETCTMSLRQCASELKHRLVIVNGIGNKKESAGAQTTGRTCVLMGWHGCLLVIRRGSPPRIIDAVRASEGKVAFANLHIDRDFYECSNSGAFASSWTRSEGDRKTYSP